MPKPIGEREVYDGLIELFCTAGIITGRKKGAAGKLAVKRPSQAKMILGLTPRTEKPSAEGDLVGKFEHIDLA